MKFLKSDGTIEEGEALEDYAASFLTNLEEYLHQRVCRNSYHANYEGKRCQEAAQFLLMVVTTIDKGEWGEVIDEKLNPRYKPEPVITVEDAVGPDPVPESPTPAVEKDEISF